LKNFTNKIFKKISKTVHLFSVQNFYWLSFIHNKKRKELLKALSQCVFHHNWSINGIYLIICWLIYTFSVLFLCVIVHLAIFYGFLVWKRNFYYQRSHLMTLSPWQGQFGLRNIGPFWGRTLCCWGAQFFGIGGHFGPCMFL
jgi:hypothetical protein